MSVMDLEQAAAELIRLTRAGPPRAGGTRVAAIDGPSGSGKTTLAGMVTESSGWPVVHLDLIYPGWDGLAQTPQLLVDGILRPLSEGRDAGFHRWDWKARRPGRWVAVPRTEVIVLDGVASAAAPVRPYLSAIAWVEAPRPQRYHRAMARDGEVYRSYWQRWAEQETVFHAADGTRARADITVDTGGTGSVQR